MAAEQQQQQHNRTWLSSIVFLDIVAYSKRPVEQQIDIKDHLNELIAETINRVAARDRIMIDAGDGVALCYLGDPEEALFMAMHLCDELKVANQTRKLTYDVRVGINLGPIKVVKDINGRQNVLGDGINVAQRVMAFAGDNQILVSRSFFEVIGCLSKEYEDLFHYKGVHKDKHVREHEVYEVKLMGSGDTAKVTVMPHVTQVVEPVSVDLQAGEPPTIKELADSGPAPETPLRWNPAVLKGARDQLAPYIGPLASILVKKAAEKTASIEALYAYLAEAITSEQDKELFLRQVAANEQPVALPAANLPPSKPTPSTGPVTDEIPSGTPIGVFDPETLADITAKLAPYVGPLAKVLVKKAAKRAENLDALCERLAGELDADADRQAFLNSVR